MELSQLRGRCAMLCDMLGGGCMAKEMDGRVRNGNRNGNGNGVLGIGFSRHGYFIASSYRVRIATTTRR